MSKLFVISAACLLSLNVFAAKVEVAIKGMTCAMCEASVTKKLSKTGKCENIKVSAEDKKATFETVEGKEISDEEIKKAIAEAGYEAVTIDRK